MFWGFYLLKICYEMTQKNPNILEDRNRLKLNNRYFSPTFQANKKKRKKHPYKL